MTGEHTDSVEEYEIAMGHAALAMTALEHDHSNDGRVNRFFAALAMTALSH